MNDCSISYNPGCNSADYWRCEADDSPEYARKLLLKSLQRAGTITPDSAESKPVEKLFNWPSPLSLKDMINAANRHSDNFRAEILALMLCRADSGSADYKHWPRTLENHLPVRLSSLKAVDGSGLSKQNRISTADLCRLCESMASQKNWTDSLALAGRSGTLKQRFRKSPFDGRLRAKTGTMSRTTALSGLFTEKNGSSTAISYIANDIENEDSRRALEQLALLFR